MKVIKDTYGNRIDIEKNISKYFTPLAGLFMPIYITFWILMYRYVFFNPAVFNSLKGEGTELVRVVNIVLFGIGIGMFFFIMMELADFYTDMYNYFYDRKTPQFKIKLKQAFQLAKISEKFCPVIVKIKPDNCFSSSYTSVKFFYDGELISGSFMSYYFLSCAFCVHHYVQFFLSLIEAHKEKIRYNNRVKQERKEHSKKVLKKYNYRIAGAGGATMRDVTNLKAKDYEVNLIAKLDLSKLFVVKLILYHIVVVLAVLGVWEVTKFFSNKSGSLMICVGLFFFLLLIAMCLLFALIECVCIYYFFVELLHISKLPLMKLSCRRVKVLINNLENFEAGIVGISKIGYYDDYYDVKSFYGYIMNESVAFKPNFLGFFYLFCEDMFKDIMSFFNTAFISPILGETENRKKKKIKVNENTIISIEALNKEIAKMQKQTNVYFQQAKEELDKIDD